MLTVNTADKIISLDVFAVHCDSHTPLVSGSRANFTLSCLGRRWQSVPCWPGSYTLSLSGENLTIQSDRVYKIVFKAVWNCSVFIVVCFYKFPFLIYLTLFCSTLCPQKKVAPLSKVQ